MEWFGVTREQIDAVMEFVAQSLEDAPNLPKRVAKMADSHAL
jgi:hypothetical protein